MSTKKQTIILSKIPPKKIPWYLQTWVIALLFALWWLLIPLIVGAILLFKQAKYFKALQANIISDALYEREEISSEIEHLTSQRDSEKEKLLSEVKAQKDEIELEISRLITDRDTEREKLLSDVKDKYDSVSKNIVEKEHQLIQLNKKVNDLNKIIIDKSKSLIDLEGELEYQDFGLYTPKYNCMSSDEYKEKIKKIREQQRQLISQKKALSFFDGWMLDGSKAKGSAMNSDNMKMVLLAFNGECDSIINKVKFNNVEKIEERIIKIADKINKLNTKNRITIKKEYISLKLDELYLSYEYEQKKQDEREEIRRIREEEREEQRLVKELEEARKEIDKEKSHYQIALEKIKEQLLNASNEEKELLSNKQLEIETKLCDIQAKIQDLDYREANTKAGYVYVISNIGSFGENVYKIGMTRRLDPMDRINELGDASVPFKFDVHAMIFSDNAPKLESALHNAFDGEKVNMVNGRKEFFNVKLDEIEKVIRNNYEKTVDFNRTSEAEEFRKTQIIKKITPIS